MGNSYFTEQELNKASQIIKKGLDLAKKSFSSIANQKVDLQSTNLKLFDASEHEINVNKEGVLTLLTTAVIGDLHGKSYLIFNSEETHEIYDSCLPESIKHNADDSLKDAIVLEIDNIISAAVITEISNELNLKIFGDVPELRKLSKEDLQNYLNMEFSVKQEYSNNMCLWIDSHFIFENKHKLNPNFIWRLNDKFIEAIRESIKANVDVTD